MWALTPLYIATADHFLFNIRLEYYHHIGMVSMIICAIVLGLNGVFEDSPQDEQTDLVTPDDIEYPEQRLFELHMPPWPAILFGIFTPVLFTTNNVITKWLCNKDQNPFNASNLSFSSYLFTNLVVIIFAVPYWVFVGFQFRMFIIGLLGGLINTFGLVCVQLAIASGPGGPVQAIIFGSNLFLVVIEAVKYTRLPTTFEFTSLVFGAYGALIMVIPDIFEKFCFCWCIKREDNDYQKVHQEQE